MATEKKYVLDVTATILNLEDGESVSFVVAGEGREVSLDTLRTLKSRHQLPVEITLEDNATVAVVTKL